MIMKILTYFGATLAFAILLGFGFYFASTYQVADGSVSWTNEYNATTSYAAYPVTTRVLKRGYGSIGSVVITGDNTGTLKFYNATTAVATQRASSKATSSILIAEIPASAPEGTYTFDVIFTDGLLMVATGAEATGTITYR